MTPLISPVFRNLLFCGYGEPTCALPLLEQTARYVRRLHPRLNLRLNTNGLGSLENGRDIVPELAGLLDSVSISLNAPDEKEYNRVTKPTLTGAYKAMLDFAKACKKSIPDTRMTVVDVLSPEDIEKAARSQPPAASSSASANLADGPRHTGSFF